MYVVNCCRMCFRRQQKRWMNCYRWPLERVWRKFRQVLVSWELHPFVMCNHAQVLKYSELKYLSSTVSKKFLTDGQNLQVFCFVPNIVQGFRQNNDVSVSLDANEFNFQFEVDAAARDLSICTINLSNDFDILHQVLTGSEH